MGSVVQSLLRFAGKGEKKVLAVFGFAPGACHQAVLHLRRGAPEVPIWLFSTEQPLPETIALCEHVFVRRNPVALLFHAERRLWRRWVALSVGTWTGGHGRWALKLAPFLVPPFKTLLLNNSGDFLAGTPANVVRHCVRRVRDALHPGWRFITYDIWRFVAYHVWRSGPCRRVRDVTDATCLWLAGIVLRCCSNPHRRLFPRLHGNQALEIAESPDDSAGFATFVQPGPKWDLEGLERLARSSQERWILWQADAGFGPIDDLLPLFSDARTFAVTRQTYFRAWKPLLFPAAPFRALQPEEASQVLAPVSRRILVDRRKLLALGIPRCSMPGTAWMMLFWKAAAAGWCSYCVGQDRQLCEQPDSPVDEAGFMFHFLRHKAMRRLGPREPDLSRGTIAFAPAFAGRAASNGRLRVLVVSPFLPYPLSHGGAVRIYSLCRALCNRVDFALAAIREAEDVVNYARLHEIFREVYVVDKDERESADENLPAQVRQQQSRSLRALIEDVAREWRPDALQIEYTHMAAFRDAAPAVPAILVEHDLTFNLYRQLAAKPGAAPADQREYGRWLAFEQYWLREFDAVWTVSEADRKESIRVANRNPDRIFVVPNGVDIRRYVPSDETSSEPEILFVGSFRHLPNVLGFAKLRSDVMPAVWKVFPNARLRVVAGPQYELHWRNFAASGSSARDGRVRVDGFIEDLRPLYARATVVVVPLEVSAGTNIKVLEAMACGKAIVTTGIGCAGLDLRDRHDACIAAKWDEFARSVCELLGDPALRSRIATQGRMTAEARFSWTAIADRAYESYRTICGADARQSVPASQRLL